MSVVVAISVVGVVALCLVGRSLSGGSAKRLFGSTPLETVDRATAGGVHRLAGVARPIGEPPVSEASGRPYVARDLRLRPHDGSGSSTMRAASQAVEFLLDDGTGRALVRATGAAVMLDRDHEAPRTTLDRVPWADALLRAAGYHNGSPSTCTVRIYEGVLQPGERAGVVGYVEAADDEARALGAAIVVRRAEGTPLAVRREPAVVSSR